MSTPTLPPQWPNPSGPDADGDDQHWLDLMAGRSAPDASARTRNEAAWLRAALLSYRQDVPPGVPAPADERVMRLLTRARAEGVLPAQQQAHPAPAQPLAHPSTHPPAAPMQAVGAGRAAPANRWRYALAAGMAGLAAVLVFAPGRHGLQPVDGDLDGSTLRGVAVQRIEAAEPLPRRQQLLQALREAGLDAQPYERLGRAGIDVALPVPLPAPQAAALRGLGLTPPTGPSLQIEVVPAAVVPNR